MKFGFVTCVQLGLSCIERIYEIGGKLDLLITLPDQKARSKSGRIYLDEISEKHQIPLFKVSHINNEECIKIIKEYQLDWLFIIGWSQIAASEVLSSPTKGCIGMHPTLLPLGRGRAAIPWAIIKGLEKTGVTMFVMDEGVDTGGILGQIEIPLNDTINATELYNKVDKAHVELIGMIYPKLNENNVNIIVQDETFATYWQGRKPEDGMITSEMTMSEVDRLIRGTTRPYPGAFYWNDNQKIIVWDGEINSKILKGKNLIFPLVDGYLYPLQFTIENK